MDALRSMACTTIIVGCYRDLLDRPPFAVKGPEGYYFTLAGRGRS